MRDNPNFHPLDFPLHVVVAGWFYRWLARRREGKPSIQMLLELYNKQLHALRSIYEEYDQGAQDWASRGFLHVLKAYQNSLAETFAKLDGIGVTHVVRIPLKKDDK